MFQIRVLFLILLLSAVEKNLTGQELQMRHWSLEDGLSNSAVTDLIQDRYGFIWLATEHGLNRFDGTVFKTYRYDPYDSTSIAANYQDRVFEDCQGDKHF